MVRDNQRACLPYVKSGRAEALLRQKYPEIAQARDRERKAKIESVATQVRLNEADGHLVGSHKNRDHAKSPQLSPTLQKSLRKGSKDNNFKSPRLTSKTSLADLMFDMDEDDFEYEVKTTTRPSPRLGDPEHHEGRRLSTTAMRIELSESQHAKSAGGADASPPHGSETTRDQSREALAPPASVQAWGASPLPSSKLSMKEIIAQTSSSRTSNLSASLSNQTLKGSIGGGGRLSQRERKKQQHQGGLSPPATPLKQDSDNITSSPWRAQSPGPRVSLREVLHGEGEAKGAKSPSLISTTSIPPLSLQGPSEEAPRKGLSPQTSHERSLQERKVSSRAVSTPLPARPSTALRSPPLGKDMSRVTPAESSLPLSMADIISQQEVEQEIRKQAVAKRSLQEIQQEQAFMEWWDAESKRVNDVEENQGGNGEGQRARASRGGRGRANGKGGGSTRGKARSVSAGAPGSKPARGAGDVARREEDSSASTSIPNPARSLV